MRAFNGAKICEPVDTFLLYQLSKNFNKKDISLYTNDRRAIFKNFNDSKSVEFKNIYKNYLKITT